MPVHPTIQTIHPARSFKGSLALPGDKSISHRYAMLAGLAEGTTRLSNFSTGADPHSSLACMQALGAKVVHKEDKTIEITGTAGSFQQPTAPLEISKSSKPTAIKERLGLGRAWGIRRGQWLAQSAASSRGPALPRGVKPAKSTCEQQL